MSCDALCLVHDTQLVNMHKQMCRIEKDFEVNKQVDVFSGEKLQPQM